MKKNILLLLLIMTLSLVGSIQEGYCQLYVDEESNAAVGTETSPLARMTISNGLKNFGLKVETDLDSGTEIYGVHSQIENTGLGSKYGFYTNVYQNASGASAYGTFGNVFPAGSSTSFGLYSSVQETGTGDRYGIYSYTRKPAGTSGDNYGIYTNTTSNGSGNSYGISNYLDTGSSDDTFYGIYTIPQGNGTGQVYNIFSHMNGRSGYAGYFVGDVIVYGNFTQVSDAGLKQDVEGINGALKLIKELSPKTYTYKNVGENGYVSSTKQYGFLAQQVAESLPELVKEIDHPGRNLPTNSDPSEPEVTRLEPDESIQSVNYIALIPILTQALKEQNELVEQQRALIDALTERVKSLEEN